MIKTLVTFATIALVSFNASALTLKKGEVIASEGGVMQAHETVNGVAQLAAEGFLVAAGNLYLDVAGETVTVALSDIVGKSKADMIELIGEAAAAQIGEAYDTMEAAQAAAVEANVAEAQEAGINAISSSDSALADKLADAVANNTELQVHIASAADHANLMELHEKLGIIEPGTVMADGHVVPNGPAQ